MARDAPTGVVEQKLLLQVLEQGIPLEEVKNWLDDAFQVQLPAHLVVEYWYVCGMPVSTPIDG